MLHIVQAVRAALVAARTWSSVCARDRGGESSRPLALAKEDPIFALPGEYNCSFLSKHVTWAAKVAALASQAADRASM